MEEVEELKSIYECMEENYDEGMKRLNASKTFGELLRMLERLKEWL